MSGASPHSPCSSDDYYLDYPLLGCDEHDTNPPATVPVCTHETLIISPTTISNGVAETYYSQQFTASDSDGNPVGNDQVSWSWYSTDMPVNCSLWSNSGKLECYSYYNEIPLLAGTYNFTVSVQAHDGWADGSRDYTWVVDPLLVFDPDVLQPGRLTQPYSQTVTVSAGASPYTLTLSSGTLPDGITFDEATDSFTGTPTEIGNFPDIVIQAVDANGITKTITYALTVLPEHLFTWDPTEPLEGQSATFTGISGYTDYYWMRGYDPGDTCDADPYFVGYDSPISIPFNGSGQYQVCLRIWEPTIYDFIYDTQWVTVENGPPTSVYISVNPQPSLVGETIYPYAYIYDFSDGPFTCTVDWGDGSPVESVTTVLGESYCELPTHAYGSIGPFTIEVTASEQGVVGSITETITHDVVYYFAEDYYLWLTSNFDPTTIELVAYSATNYTDLGFTIATPPENGSLGIPTFVGCEPVEGEGPFGLMNNQAGYQIERASDQGLEGTEITVDKKAALSAEMVQELQNRMRCWATVVYEPTIADPLYVGNDGFTFRVNDGTNGDSNVASVQLWVDANSAPTALDSSSLVHDTGPTYVLLTATDPDEYDYSFDRITFTIESTPSNGALGTVSPAYCDTICDDYTCAVECKAVVVYTPDAGATTDSFTFKVNDSHYDSNVATVSVEEHIPLTLHVNALDDIDDEVCDGTHCSLREAVNAALIGDTIDFTIDPASLPATITLVNGEILISKDLTITGPGAEQLAISGGALLGDGNDGSHDRVFEVYDYASNGRRPVTAVMSGLTIRDGRAGEGGGIIMGPGSIVTLNDCVIGPNNIVTYAGGGIASEGGTLTLNRCTVADNHGTGSMGGAGIVSFSGTTTLINSTVTGNITNNYGGGIYAVYGGTVNLIQSTVSGNTANNNYLEEPWGGGGGIYISDAVVNIQNSIVAGNFDRSVDHTPSDDVLGVFTSLGGNLIGDGTGSSGWVSGDLVGTEAARIEPMLDSISMFVPDVPDTSEDPWTYSLTYVFALLEGSPAIDAAPTCEVFEDQRGVTRPQPVSGSCDIGAYELVQTASDTTPPELTITGALDGTTPMAGELATGYILQTANNPAVDHLVQFADETSSNEPLKDTYFGLYLVGTTVSAADLQAYYIARGVPDPWLTHLIGAANGTDPFVYIKGTSVTLVDAAQHDHSEGNPDNPMTIPDDFPLGTYTVAGDIEDLAGNKNTVTLILIVAGDRVPPVIAAHDDVTAEATSAAGAIVSYTSPATSDNVDASGTADCTPSSGSQFSLGDTTVNCNATDTAGNAATPTTFIVHVEDTTAPEVTVPGNMTVPAPDQSGVIATFSASASDIVDGVLTPSCNPVSGSLFPVGSTTVTCSATDAAGNIGSASFTLTVTYTAPVPLSQLTTAKATCIQFSSGTATDVDRLLYTSTYNKKIYNSVIKSVTPSTFLYYVKANLPAEASSLVIAQVNNINFPAMLPSVTLYDANCVRLSPTLGTAVIANGNVTVSFTSGAAERVVYVGVKYSARPIIGQSVTEIGDIQYSFSAALNSVTAFTSDDLTVTYIQ